MKFQTETRRKVADAILCSLAVALSLVTPLTDIYFNNYSELTLPIGTFCGYVGILIVVFSAVLLGIQLPFMKYRHFPLINLSLLGLCLMAFVQRYALARYFTGIAGGDNWLVYLAFLALNTILLLLPAVLLFVFRKHSMKFLWKIAVIIICGQGCALVYSLVTYQTDQFDFREYTISEENKFIFAKEDNVIMLVVDCMSEYRFKEAWQKYPEIHEIFNDFICFDRMASPKPFTMYAVPALLTGRLYDGSETFDKYLLEACYAEDSLLMKFQKHGYRVEAYPFIVKTVFLSPDLLNNSIKRTSHRRSIDILLEQWIGQLVLFTPDVVASFYRPNQFITPGHEAEGNEDIRFYRDMRREMALGDFEKSFKYLHLHGVHQPLEYDETVSFNPKTDLMRQLRGSLKIIREFLQKLKELGIYDNATIVITGDHTEEYTPEIVTFIKPPHRKRDQMAINSVPAVITDVCPTILSEKKLMDPSASLFSRNEITGSMETRVRYDSREYYIERWAEKTLSGFEEKRLLLNECRGYIRNNRLLLDFPPFEAGSSVAIVLKNTGNGGCWSSESVSFASKTKEGCTLSSQLPACPDGHYAMYLVICGQNKIQTKWLLGNSLKIENGIVSTIGTVSAPAQRRPFKIGETVQFGILNALPQIELSDNCKLNIDSLTVKPESIITISLPEHAGKLVLSLRGESSFRKKTPLYFYDGEKELAKITLSPGDKIETDIPVPPGTKTLNLKFATTLNKAQFPKQSIRLKSMQLNEKK